MIIPVPIPIFIRRVFEKSEQDREIDAHIQITTIRLSIQQEAEILYNKAINKLTERQKKKIERLKVPMVFPTRGDYLDWLRGEIERRYNIKKEDYSFMKAMTQNKEKAS